jgi:hypothetical protein
VNVTFFCTELHFYLPKPKQFLTIIAFYKTGLVGGVVLPLLGAVPDGAIILFSGLGDYETAQETLSVGVGALAGSTIMLLTVYVA